MHDPESRLLARCKPANMRHRSANRLATGGLGRKSKWPLTLSSQSPRRLSNEELSQRREAHSQAGLHGL